MSKEIGIFYGSTTGNTEDIAQRISDAFSQQNAEIMEISGSSPDDLQKYKYLILGTSTWGIGELQDDWEGHLDILDDVDFSDKKVALFGTGDQEGYPDSFLDAMGIIHEKLAGKNAVIIGETSTEGFSFDHSKAVVNGNFVGLAIDSDNQDEQTDSRINDWISTIEHEFV